MASVRKVDPISKSNKLNQEIDGLLSGIAWNETSLTYSFPQSASAYEGRYGSGEPTKGFSSFSLAEQEAFISIFDQIAGFTQLALSEGSESGATIRIARSDLPNAEAWAYYPSTAPEGGDAWFSNSPDSTLDGRGSYLYTVYMHEVGHTLGLKHSFEGGQLGVVPKDSLEYTVMSYSSYVGAGNWYVPEGSYPQTFMMYDIAALQYIYGSDYTTNEGATNYQWNPETGALMINGTLQPAPMNNKIFMTVWDGNGIDTYDFSLYSTNLSIDLRPGGWTITSADQLADLGHGNVAAGNIANALHYSFNEVDGAFAGAIENAIGGSGDDTIIGNNWDNRLQGSGGDDLIDGLGGVNTAVYLGASDEYTWVQVDGGWRVTDKTLDRDGADFLLNVQLLEFSDGLVELPAPPPPPPPSDGGGSKPGKGKPNKVATNDTFGEPNPAQAFSHEHVAFDFAGLGDGNGISGFAPGRPSIDLFALRPEGDWLFA